MKIFFTEKPKRKYFSRIMDGVFIIILLYFLNVLNHNPFLSFKDLVFTILLMILGLSNSIATTMIGDRSFFETGDRMKRYIISNIAILLIFIICVVIVYFIFQTILL